MTSDYTSTLNFREVTFAHWLWQCYVVHDHVYWLCEYILECCIKINFFLSFLFFSNVSLVKVRNINNFSHGFDRWIIRRQLIQCFRPTRELRHHRNSPWYPALANNVSPKSYTGPVVPDKVKVQQKLRLRLKNHDRHLVSEIINMYRMAPKSDTMQTEHLILAHNFGKCWPIFEILSPFAEAMGKNQASCLYDPLFCAIPIML